ncbi:MAG: EAL domain-containing protein [Kineosporiaceae bacterium]
MSDRQSAERGILLEELLALARRSLRMDLAFVSWFTDGRQVVDVVGGDAATFEIGPGASVPYDGSYCARVVRGDLPQVIPDAAALPGTAALPVTDRVGIGAYVGAPLRDDAGGVLGMLCCIARGPRPDLDDRAAGLLDGIATVIGREAGERRRAGVALRDVRADVEAAVGGEIDMVFQPIVDLTDLTPTGAEALARFRRPPRRPDLWFVNAAKVGLAAELELTAAGQALQGLDRLPDGVYLSVNASPALLLDPRLDDLLADAPPDRVVLEVTEHESVADYARLRERLRPLRERGFRLAVDDAGAGYASFRHVLRLSPDVIKLDIDLTRGMDADPVRRSLAGALARLADGMGALVVAEGVETEAEREALLDVGIDHGQGFGLGRPGPLPLRNPQVSPMSTDVADIPPGGADHVLP